MGKNKWQIEKLKQNELEIRTKLQVHYNQESRFKIIDVDLLNGFNKFVTVEYSTGDTKKLLLNTYHTDIKTLVELFVSVIDKNLKVYKNELITEKAFQLFSRHYTFEDVMKELHKQVPDFYFAMNKKKTTFQVPKYNIIETFNTMDLMNLKKTVKTIKDSNEFCVNVDFKKTDMLEIIIENILTSIKKKSFIVEKDKEIEEKLKEIYNEYELLMNEKLGSKKYNNHMLNYKVSMFDYSICGKNRDMKIVKKDETITVELCGKFKKDMELVKSEKYQEAKILLNKFLTDLHEYQIINLYSFGCFFGETSLSIQKDDWSAFIQINEICNENESINDWYHNLITEISKQVLEKETKIKQQRKIAYNRTKKFREQFIVRDIVKFIDLNSQYITEKAVIQYIRGNKVQLNTEIKEINGFIPYTNYTINQITNIIYQLIQENIIEEREYDGTFQIFYTLRPANNDYKQILTNVKEENITVNPFSKAKFNDFEAEKIFFDYEKKIELMVKDYVMLFNLTTAKGFLNRYYNQYVSLMQSAPEEVKKLWKMKIDTEQDKFMKRFLKEIVKGKKDGETRI